MSDSSSLETRTLKGLLWTFGGTAAQTIVNAVVVVVLARLLTPQEYGIIGAALIVVNLAQIFVQLGVGPALVQLPIINSLHIRSSFTISVLIGIGFGGLIAIFARQFAGFFGAHELTAVLRTLSVVFPLTSLAAVGRALLQRSMNFRALAVIDLISFASGYGLVGIVSAAAGLGIWALVAANIGQTLLATILILHGTRSSFGLGWYRKEARELLVYGAGHSLARIANYIANQADNLVVGRQLPTEALGLYTRAYQLMMLPTNLIGQVLDRVMFPAFASIQEKPERLRRAFVLSQGIVALTALPLTALMFVLAPDIIAVLLGSLWLDVVEPFRILILVLVFRTAYKLSDSLARATGAVYRRAWRQWIYAAAVLVGAVVGNSIAGLLGVASGVAFAVVLNYFLMLQLSLRLTAVPARDIAVILMRHLGVAVALGGIAWFLRNKFFTVDFPALLTVITVPLLTMFPWFTVLLLKPGLLGPEGDRLKSYIDRLFSFLRKPAAK